MTNTTTIVWTVNEVDCYPEQPYPKYVYNVHWTCTATGSSINPETNKPYTISRYGTWKLPYNLTGPYIPYEDLTESKLIEWVHEEMNKTEDHTVSIIQEGLNRNITEQMNPPSIQPSLPW